MSEPARWGTAGAARRVRAGRRGRSPPHRLLAHTGQLGAFARRLNARAERLGAWQPPRGAGVAASALIIFGSIALGVVYGDIGTGPLYAFHEAAIAASDGHSIARATVLGVLSLILWALIVTVTLKYVLILLRADNNGEGGTLSLTALASRALGPRTARSLSLASSVPRCSSATV